MERKSTEDLFSVDPIDAAKLGMGRQVPPELRPIRELMVAILEDAVNCLSSRACSSPCYHYKRGQDCKWHDAIAWFLEKDSEYPYSFENVCETLSFDPEYLRRGLIQKHRLTAHRNLFLPERICIRLLLNEARKTPNRKAFSIGDFYEFLPDINPQIVRQYAERLVDLGFFLASAMNDKKIFLYPTKYFRRTAR